MAAGASRAGSVPPSSTRTSPPASLDRIDPQALGRRPGQHLAGADVEQRLMQRALDRVALHEAVGERRIGVRADAVGGKISSPMRNSAMVVPSTSTPSTSPARNASSDATFCHAMPEHSVRSSRRAQLAQHTPFPHARNYFPPSNCFGAGDACRQGCFRKFISVPSYRRDIGGRHGAGTSRNQGQLSAHL